MSRKLKGILTASALLVFSAVTVTGLASCQQEEPTPDPVEDVVITKIEITNKATLSEPQSLTAGRLLMEINVETEDGSVGANELISNGDLVVKSSDTNVATVSGRYITLLAQGTTTISVENRAATVKDSFTLTVTPREVLELTDIGDIMDGKVETGTTVNIKGQIVQNSSSGYFMGDADGDIIYVYNVLAAQYKVGDTVIVTGDIDEYGGLYQVGSGGSYKITANYEGMGDDIDILNTIKYTELTSEMANNFGAKTDDQTDFTKNALKHPVPVKITVTMIDEFTDGKYLWRAAGFDAKTVIYTGYMLASDTAEYDFKVGDRYTMEGFINGTGTHNQYTNRINFYPNSFHKEESIPVTELKIEAGLSELMIGQETTLTHTVGPDGSAGTVTYTSSDPTIVSVDGNTIKGLKAGEVTITGKVDGYEVTAEIKITVINKEYKPASIAETLTSVKKGETVFIYGIYSYNVSGYGIFVDDGTSAILVYKGTAPSGTNIGDYVTVQGTYDEFNGTPQIKDATVLKVSATDLATKPTAGVPVDLNKKDEIVVANANRGVSVKEAVISDYDWSPRQKADGYDIASFKIAVGSNTYAVRVDSRYTASADMDKFGDKALNGTKISFDARLGFFSGNPQIQYLSNVTIVGEGTETPEEPEEPETPVDALLTLSFADDPFGLSTTYVANKDLSLEGRNYYLSNGCGKAYQYALTVGYNKPENFKGNVKAAVAKAIDSTISADTQKVTYKDAEYNISSFDMNFDAGASKSITYQFKEEGGTGIKNSEYDYGFILESTDKGTTWKIAKEFETGLESVTYEKSEASESRYSIAFLRDPSQKASRTTIAKVVFGK